MKKIVIVIAAVTAAALVLGAVGCGKKSQLGTTEVVGGWEPVASPEVTAEVQSLMDKALEGFTGAMYEPVAYVATQVVAGTNHLLLCTVTPVVPDATGSYAMVTLYEDLDGNVTISNVAKSAQDVPSAGLAGGWQAPESPVMTDEVAGYFKKAAEGGAGSVIEPVALVGQQVVAGMNYRALCVVTPVVPDAESHYSLVTVYKDLQGNCTFTDFVDFEE